MEKSRPTRPPTAGSSRRSGFSRPVVWQRSSASGPLRWYRLRQQIDNLQAMQAEIEKVLPEAMDALEQLHRQSWEVALQARQFQDRLHEASQSLHYLQGRGLQGEDFQAAIDREASLQAALASIPAPFLTAPQEDILAQPDRMSVTSVHQLFE